MPRGVLVVHSAVGVHGRRFRTDADKIRLVCSMGVELPVGTVMGTVLKLTPRADHDINAKPLSGHMRGH